VNINWRICAGIHRHEIKPNDSPNILDLMIKILPSKTNIALISNAVV
jgi:hypothetical protein